MMLDAWIYKRWQIPLLAAAITIGSAASAWGLILNVTAPPLMSITDDVGSLVLSFPHFRQGTESSPQPVTYRIQCNNLTARGSGVPLVTAQMESPFDMADLEAAVSGYVNLGDPSFATLNEAQPGYVPIGGAAAPLANKQAGQGQGDACLDGELTITWRAKLTQDAPAGSESRNLTLTLKGQ